MDPNAEISRPANVDELQPVRCTGTTFTIRIVRNSPTIAGTIIYTAVHSTTGNPVDLVSFSAQDLGAPAGLLTTYAAFVNTVTGSVITRVGPEVFYGIAAED